MTTPISEPSPEQKQPISPTPSLTMTDQQIKDFAKKHFIKESWVKQAQKSGNLEILKTFIDKGLPLLSRRATAKAIATLGEHKATLARVGLSKKLLIQRGQGTQFFVGRELKTLGKGSYGKAKAYQSVANKVLLVGKFARTKPGGKVRGAKRRHRAARKDAIREFQMLRGINPHGNVPGIQLPPKGIIDLNPKTPDAIGYLGVPYDGDGKDLMKDPKYTENPKTILNSMHQVFYGLVHLKTVHVFHGDIKPANMFQSSTDEGVILHLADFGGAAHLRDDVELSYFVRDVYSEAFTCEADDKAIMKEIDTWLKKKGISPIPENIFDKIDLLEEKLEDGEKRELRDTLREILHKGDVYSAAVSFCEMITGSIDYDQLELDKKGIPLEIMDLIGRALEDDYTKRPEPEEFAIALDLAYKSLQ